MAAYVPPPQMAEEDLLLTENETPEVRNFGGWRRPLAAAAAIALAGTAVFVTKKAVTPCTELRQNELLGLAELNTQEVSKMLANVDKEHIKEWLKQSNEADAERNDMELPKLSAAMSEEDREAADEKLKKIADRSLESMHGKRQALKTYLQDKSRGLAPLRKKFRESPAATAECVFNIEQALAQMAALGANIADSAATCDGPDKGGVNLGNNNGAVCVTNIGGVFYSVSTVAASISLAVENCGKTIFPNYKALCSGAATGAAASLSQLASMSGLTAAACKPEHFHQTYPGVTAANFGVKGVSETFDRRLSESNSTAEARRLLYGGGKGSMGTHCAVDTTSIAWWLAQAGLAINAAVNPKEQQSCKAPFLKRGDYKKYQTLVCTVDAIGAVHGFLQAINYMLLAVSHCTDTADLPTMCGAGIEGIISSLTGSTAAGISTWLTCYKAQGWRQMHDGQLKQSKLREIATQAMMNHKVLGLKEEGNYGRRLAEESQEELESLKAQFGTPAEAWKSMGFDFSDSEAAFRHIPEAKANVAELTSLLEAKDHTPGLFDMCSA